MTTYANRGKPFEDFIKLVHTKYQSTGLACVHKVPTEFIPIRNSRGEICSCKVEEKSCVDYLGRYRNVPVAVEAKHTEGNRISFGCVEPHQADYMNDFCKAEGVVGLVLVSFSLSRFFAVPWPFWREAREVWMSGRKRGVFAPVKAHGWFWDTPGGASAAPDDFKPEWEIKLGGGYSLPYLHIIDNMERK